MAVEEELNVNDILLSGPVASEGLPPNHPLLREAQATLKEHLRKRLVNLDERLFELNVERKKLDKEHNEVGQNLYNEQQRVKGFKNQITKLANDEEESKKRRAASEAELRKTIEQLREEEAEVAARKNALFKAQEDYNDLKFALQKAQEHTANLENAIKLKRRELYKDAEDLRHSEIMKMRQDFFLDRLHSQLHEMNEQKEFINAQIKAQQADLQACKTSIQEAQRETDEILRGKRQLRTQLNNCIHGLEMRYKAEQSIKHAMETQEAKATNVQNDIREVERTLRDLQEANEHLTLQRNSTSTQLEGIKVQIDKTQNTQKQMQQQISLLSSSLKLAEEDAKKTEDMATSLANQREAMIREVQQSVQDCNLITNQIFEALASQASITRMGNTHHKETKALLQACEKQEEELVKVEFEAAQLNVESIGVKAQIAAAEEEVKGLNEEITAKENLLDQHQAEIRKGHILISRKQQLVDQLNREYDAKRSAHGEEPSGVLDQTIRSLRTQISQNSQNITELQQAWIKKQTELISLQAKVGEKQEEIAAKKDEMLIRKQHSHRINAEVEATKKEIKSLNSELKDMDHLVDRMGRQLAAFKQQQVQFESQAKAIQEEAQMQIAQKEQEKQNLLNNVQEAEKERDGSLEELLDLERQVTLWERKIKLEKEIQDAIDPNIGQAELAAMRKEIHRMELREIQLKKTQQHLLKELKQVLSKRDLIHMRHAPKTGTAQETHKKVVLQRQITALDSKLRETEEKANKTENELEESTKAFTEVESAVSTLKSDISEKEDQIKKTEKKLEKDKVRLAFEKACLVHLQRLTKDLESITDEDLKIPLKPSAQLALHKVQNEAANVAAAIGEVEQEAPALQEVLELFKKWAVHLVSANDTYKLQPEALRFSD